MDISICICTFRRPALLDALLPKLDEQARALQARAGLRAEILVADNDPQHSAVQVLERRAAELATPIRWTHVPQPNIALARNSVIALGTGHTLVFIDDDETPSPRWLEQLLATQQASGADVVFAPVVATYRAETPAWMIAGRFFERRRFKTGAPVPVNEARTGNVLMDRSLIASLDGPFDLSFGNTGGEDTRLFRSLHDGGAHFVWCDEAEVFEEVPTDRATLGWLLRRSYRVGQTYLRSEWLAARDARAKGRIVLLLARAVAQGVLAVALTLGYAPFSRPRAVRWLRVASSQAGKLSVLFGHQFHEYGKQSG